MFHNLIFINYIMKDVFINSRHQYQGRYNNGIVFLANPKNNFRTLNRPNPLIFSLNSNQKTITNNKENTTNIIENPMKNCEESVVIVNKKENIVNKKTRAQYVKEKIEKMVDKKQNISHRDEGFLLKE